MYYGAISVYRWDDTEEKRDAAHGKRFPRMPRGSIYRPIQLTACHRQNIEPRVWMNKMQISYKVYKLYIIRRIYRCQWFFYNSVDISSDLVLLPIMIFWTYFGKLFHPIIVICHVYDNPPPPPHTHTHTHTHTHRFRACSPSPEPPICRGIGFHWQLPKIPPFPRKWEHACGPLCIRGGGGGNPHESLSFHNVGNRMTDLLLTWYFST